MPIDFIPFNGLPIGSDWFRGLTNIIIWSKSHYLSPIPYIFFFTIAFYTHVVHHSKVSAGFPAKTQVVLVSVHSYNVSPYYFPVGLSTNLTAFAFLRNPLSSKELGLTHVQLTMTTNKLVVWTLKDLPSSSLVRYEQRTIQLLHRQTYGL